MSQISNTIEVLKQLLKANGVNYSDLARALNLSQSSVKRLFSQKNFDLDRLEKICEVININLSDLFTMIKSPKAVSQLTLEQERNLVSDPKLLLVTTCVINRWKFSDIVFRFEISEQECLKKLLSLDKIKIIELQPNNRFILKISNNFSWIPNGPVQQFFQENLQQAFFSTKFLKEDEALVVRFGMLTREANLNLQKKFMSLTETFSNYCQQDLTRPLSERRGTVLVIGLRPWLPPLLEKFKR